MDEGEIGTDTPRVNPGYAVFQIAKALTTSQEHEDPATRERAQQKIAKWAIVLNGVLNGHLDVGSRVPISGIPAWATLEVVTGGFATGELLAGGPLHAHEQELLGRISRALESHGRSTLNAYYLSDDGLAELGRRLRSGCYDVVVPEEGALLVVAWLVENGYADDARSVLDEISPFFSKLRFYPVPTDQPRRFGSRVFLQDVGNTVDSLRRIKPNLRILAQKEAIQIWTPLYDRMVGLFLETVDGPLPTLRRGPNGERHAPDDGRFPVDGGWPCQDYREDWTARAQETLDEYHRLRQEHKLCRKPDRSRDSFAQLREYLRRCITNPKSLSGRDVGRIRLILARSVAKRGDPDSTTFKDARQRQTKQVSAPTFHEIATIVAGRLAACPQKSGLDDLTAVMQPVAEDEAKRSNVAAGTSIPSTLQRKVERCLCDTVEALVDRSVITSGESLAGVLPQLTSGLWAIGTTDPSLRQLYAAIYRAFRRRRSLLLLNLENQVRIEELPWVAAIDRFRRDDLSARELARQTLEEVAVLTLYSFPHAIVPNKLLQELRALAKRADLDLPVVEEVAADIFMGEFSGRFVAAAKRAADLLEGTLYDRYFGIDYRRVRQLPQPLPQRPKGWFPRRDASDPFVQLCSSMAGVVYGTWDPAINGMIIEQQQIITTQNLAVLFGGLNLADALRDRLLRMAERCFDWICRRQQMKADKWHARLIMLKNTAYAWRQMIFFLALLPRDSVRAFLTWADDHLNRQSDDFRIRFRPALRGLSVAEAGGTLDDETANREGVRRFLGWTKTRHWLISE